MQRTVLVARRRRGGKTEENTLMIALQVFAKQFSAQMRHIPNKIRLIDLCPAETMKKIAIWKGFDAIMATKKIIAYQRSHLRCQIINLSLVSSYSLNASRSVKCYVIAILPPEEESQKNVALKNFVFAPIVVFSSRQHPSFAAFAVCLF